MPTSPLKATDLAGVLACRDNGLVSDQGLDQETIRAKFGIAFEEENARADLERWRHASDAERGRVIAQLMDHGEQIAAITGIRNDEPAPALPKPGRAAEGDGF